MIQSNGAEYFASQHVIEKISRPSDRIPTNIDYNVKDRYITNVYASSLYYFTELAYLNILAISTTDRNLLYNLLERYLAI